MILTLILEIESQSNQQLNADKVRFTSSKNNQTSTLTVTFYNPISFLNEKEILVNHRLIKNIYFYEENYRFSTKDIRLIWVKGQPILLEAIFLVTSEFESIKLKNLFNNMSKNN